MTDLQCSIRGMRILFQNRANAFDLPGGDTVVMKRLQEQLETHGAVVEFSPHSEPDNIRSYDLIHLFNLTVPQCTEAFAKNAVRHNIPFVVTSLQENFPQYYHKAVAALQWFRAYVPAITSNGYTGPELFHLLETARPVNLMSSPFAARAADMIFACGKTEADFLHSVFPDACVEVVHFGSSIKTIESPADLFQRTYKVTDFILVVGRLEIRKNQLMLLHALESSDIPIVFADGGFTYQPEYSQLCRMFKRKGTVIFTGRLDDELLVSAYHACRMHCLPSWYELPGLVSIEAARYGCPVVASSWGCLPDYLHDTCFWCAPDDPSSIYNAVMAAYESDNRNSAAAIAGNFTWERFGNETILHYEKVHQEHISFAPELVEVANQELSQPSFQGFIKQITQMVTQNKLVEALAFYDKNRTFFSGNAEELQQTDSLMMRLRTMCRQGG